MPPTKDKSKDELMKMDLYKLLNVAEDATQKQIKKAYRKKALEHHPDKNPDNPKAAAMFHQLSEALKILSDIGARAAYDHVRRAKKAALERTDKLDAKRKKVKLDLEAREQAAEEAAKHHDNKKAKTTLKQEVERLRDEGSKILEEEQMKMREQLKQERLALILSKKPGGAIIEMKNSKAAKLALSVELGLTSNPLRISWISGNLTDETAPSCSDEDTIVQPQGGAMDPPGFSSTKKSDAAAPSSEHDDFENAVLLRMKIAQEKKRKTLEES